MKLGLLCFSHYLFIKDMTRKWGCHGDGSTKSPSCMPSCIVYSFAKSAVLNRKRKYFFFFFVSLPFSCGSNNDLQIEHSSVVIFVNAERFYELALVAPKMTADAPQWGEWEKKKKEVIHGLQVVICTQEIKENGMEPFGLNDIGLNVCRGNCQFA